MRTNDSAGLQDSATDRCTEFRPRYLPLGWDTQNDHHVYRTTDETILVVDPDAGVVVERIDVTGRHVDDYVRFVRDDVDGRNWSERSYSLPGEFFAKAVSELQEAM